MEDRMSTFKEVMSEFDVDLSAESVGVLQVNITRLCNQACAHCHVDASPTRREMMDRRIIEYCLEVLETHHEIGVLDITGGAPELHPYFKHLVRRTRSLERHVIVRHNLTVTLDPHPVTGESMRWLPAFFAEQRVELVSSLPHYQPYLTDRQRGSGAFEKSIESMRLLNATGFGRTGSGLVLSLVHNPVGPYLPADQCSLERDYRRALADLQGVTFDRLYAVTNMPINRFARQLRDLGAQEEYLERLGSACNPAAALNVMCRTMVSVGPDGTLYDCDFNQMLDLAIGSDRPATICDFDAERLKGREIRFADHCFGCTAGAGSSCGGATT
ncbi:MAG: arsenosugar biosynthesis radical SAM protein ArsS [Coriobacteriia bacterium]|nr:arsenosugar biosynthesis radical SAM protein ArsS [Coriobacteriia bacterium]